MQFTNRTQAGVMLGERLLELPLIDPLVLALPRGGVPVAFEIANALGAPLDVLVVRKVGAPGQKELGIGALTENNHYWIDPQAVRHTGAHAVDVEQTLAEERKEVRRRIELYRQNRPLPRVEGRSVVVVDDGLATGVTARVACAYLKQRGAVEVILAVPVGSPGTVAVVRPEVDQLICLEEPENFYSVGQFYDDFDQLEEEEVIDYLSTARRENEMLAEPKSVMIREGELELGGFLCVPEGARGLVIFAHGSGSSRFSPRNQRVAKSLNRDGLATLLFDLLAPEEANDRKNVFAIALLGKRLELAVRWVATKKELAALPLGFFGASTGAGAALWAAATLGSRIAAVVSRGGRPDMAGELLKEVTAPTLLIVGSRDTAVIELNREALRQLRDGKLEIVPGASHLFEETGALEQVERSAGAWFRAHLARGASHAVA